MSQETNKIITKLRVLYIVSVIGVFLFALGIVNYGKEISPAELWGIMIWAGIIMFAFGGIIPNFMDGIEKVKCDSSKMAQIDAIGFIAAIAGFIIMIALSIVLGATIMGAGMMLWFFYPGAEIQQEETAA